MQHMGVDHGRLDVAMAQQLLEGANVGAAFEQVRGEGVPEGVAGGPFGELGPRHGLSDSFLH